MRFRTWPVAAVALAGLLVLIVVSLQAASHRAQDIYSELDRLNAHHREVDTQLRRLRSDVNLSGIFVRDYLLDSARERAPEYREQMAEYRTANIATLKDLRALALGAPGIEDERIPSLQSKLDDYWETFEPLFDWTPAEKIYESARFVRHELLPRREAVLAIAQEIEELNNANLAAQRGEVSRRLAAFRSDLRTLLWRSVLLGLVGALLAVMRLRVVERRSDDQRRVAQEAERQMRELSQQLVATQEEERKKLSRELHDHVGQMLTALRMELGRIDRLADAGERQVGPAVRECRQLVDSVVRTVRDLALGLRPSMLDDFGLQPALEWHVRDVTRRSGISVNLTTEGDLESLADPHRTCVYRAVQEALTNCVRHAGAARIEVTVLGKPDRLRVSVADDGVGVNPARRWTGLGLRGIEERVRELHGSMGIQTAPAGGTTITIDLPVPSGQREAPLARAAG